MAGSDFSRSCIIGYGAYSGDGGQGFHLKADTDFVHRGQQSGEGGTGAPVDGFMGSRGPFDVEVRRRWRRPSAGCRP